MLDPEEGLASDGTITTGVARHRVPAAFEPVLHAAQEIVGDDVSLYVYGSVATGQAREGASDVDLVAFGAPSDAAREASRELSARFRDLAREVAVGASSPADLGDDDEGYGSRVFLRHYCAHVCGPDVAATFPAFPGDVAAARGFNGDLAVRVEAWHRTLDDLTSDDAASIQALARRVGRKTLFAVAGLVSVTDHTWTTDRATAARRWSEPHPGLAADLDTLLAWGDGTRPAGHEAVRRMLDGPVAAVTSQFADRIGPWR